jgi:hypothetical protein
MNHLLSMAMLLMTLVPQSQKLPEEFYKLPERVRERATIVIMGTFGRGRTPCMLRPDGTRVWAIDSWFNVKSVYCGRVGHQNIRINTAMLPDSQYISKELEVEHKYLVLLRPDEKAVRAIKTAAGLSFWDSLHDEEILAIVELK